jgi:hypothetical protein
VPYPGAGVRSFRWTVAFVRQLMEGTRGMSHNYLFATHRFIEQRLALVTAAYEKAEEGTDEKFFSEGRLTAIKEFQEFISLNVDQKLPKRLYQRLKPWRL